ncbi:hypothetical protein [Streptomyces mirabilis]|uniref:hypothetical protein n=1 Tax=Streptomyces mirabilis TaxID=68239 RepID=UPI00332E0BD7
MATNHLCRVLLADFDAMPYREPTSPAGSSSPPEARELYVDRGKIAAETSASCVWTPAVIPIPLPARLGPDLAGSLATHPPHGTQEPLPAGNLKTAQHARPPRRDPPGSGN